MRFNDNAGGNEGRVSKPAPGEPDRVARGDGRGAAGGLRARRLRQHRRGKRLLSRWRAAAAPPSPSNPSTARRRRCSTAWSACSTANPSCAISRSSPAKARRPIACAAISPRRWCAAGPSIAWVWDVYDSNQQRALRLSGEEPAGKPGRDAWAAADDLVLRKIAQAGLSGLSGMINGSPADARRPPRTWPPRTRGRQPGTGHFGALGYSAQ